MEILSLHSQKAPAVNNSRTILICENDIILLNKNQTNARTNRAVENYSFRKAQTNARMDQFKI